VRALVTVATSRSASGLPPQSFEQSTESSLLYGALSSRYDSIEENIAIGPRSFFILRVRDTNELLREIRPEAFATDERLPYWAELWPSSVALAQYCLEHCQAEDQTVLELGCGLGIAGVAAARAGAHVVVSDYEPDALLFARYNALRNLPLDTVNSRIEFRHLDWRTDQHMKPVDMIIGADVVYERRNFVPILNFVRRNLKKEGCAVFTDPDRSTGMSFFALAEREGFKVALSSGPVQHAQKSYTILCGELRCAGQNQ
jgi:predicted nicotinamide N-methyase